MGLLETTLINQTEHELDEAYIIDCVNKLCYIENADYAYEVNLLVCGDAEMREYNRMYRGQDSITDVLSFTTIPDETASPVRLFDIIIDINQLDRQRGTQSLNKELSDVIIHSLLHCFGYDHIRKDDILTMKTKENYYQNLMDGTITSG